MTDIATGLYTHGAIMGALFNRERTGMGVKIEANLLSTQVACNSHIAANWLSTGVEAKRYGTGHGSIVPYQAFSTGDDQFLIVGAGNDSQFDVLCGFLDLPELASDPLFATNGDRVVNRSQLIPILSAKFKTKPLKFWLETFEGCALPYGPVNSMRQVFEDPQVAHNGMVWEFDHPSAGTVRVPGHPVKYAGKFDDAAEKSETKGGNEKAVEAAPLLGQHTDWVLRNIAGCSADEITALRDKKVVS